ncbi:SIR2 family protein [Metabacillus fastidiosus]|uniref:SIR2 family protein n=1 Tax=Metabacillus fastidiosus TaxID=1458 RepID=UPI002E204C6F|nr:SIR2 family protein [Metabacillus fastidiosus]
MIREAIDNNKLIVFVGAGVSVNSGLPSWWDLIEKFTFGIGLATRNISQDDYLKIPQYYFNARGNKEYYDLITKVFNISAKPNPIHSALLELKPCHFITTNYDELIEDSAREKGIFYDVVSKDEDLPYTPNNNMIIKMHGDLNNKNIVLKEDDYLSYSTNFKLIEHYIKALLSTHVVLLVGYSLNDTNVKLIFQWVKDILKKDFQPAYFLNIDENDSIDILEFNYYKNRGVNILNYSQIAKEPDFEFIQCDELTDKRGEKLYSFLNYLKKSDEYKELNLEYFYQKLLGLNQLNKIRFIDIIRTLDIEINYSIDADYITIYDDTLQPLIEDLNNVTKKEEKFNNTKFLVVSEIFQKANIVGFRKREENTFRILYEFEAISSYKIKRENNLMDLLMKFDYIGIKEWVGKETYEVVIDGNENDFLKKSYAFYKTQQFYEAYKLLKRISDSAFRSKNYLLYFISEFNRKNVGRIIIRSFLQIDLDEKIRNEIRNEIKKIDLENIYLNLPNIVKKNVDCLREVVNFNYFYSTINKVTTLSKKVEKEVNTLYIGVPATAKIDLLQREVNFFWEYINANCLIIENSKEIQEIYKYYIEGILTSLSIKGERVNKETVLGIEGTIIKLHKLDYFSFFIMASFIRQKDLRDLFGKYNIDSIPIEKDDLIHIMDSFVNLTNSITSLSFNLQLKVIMDSMLVVLSKVNLDKEACRRIIQCLIGLNNYEFLTRDNIKSIRIFLIGQNYNFKCELEVGILDNLIFSLLNKNLKLDGKEISSNSLEVLSIVEDIVTIIRDIEPKYITKHLQFVNLLIETIKYQNDLSVTSLERIVVSLYNICDKNLKTKIKRLVQKRLKDNFSLSFFYDVLLSDIIKSKREYEELVIKELDKIIIKRNEEIRNGTKSFPDPIDRNLELLASLLANNLLIDISLFRKYEGRNSMFDLFLDMKNFNYENFKIEWIDEFPEWVHKKLSRIKIAKETIREKLISSIIEENISKRIKEICFKYYI